MQKYKITQEQATEIRCRLKEYEKTNSFRKLQAVMLMGEDESVHTIAKTTLYHQKYIYELVKKFCAEGFEEFVKEKRGGANRRNLTEEQESKIVKQFKEKAENGQIVNLSEVKAEYDKMCGKETANSTFYDFLHRMGWRRVMPRGRHPKKASQEDIESSKKLKRKLTK